MSGDLGPNDKGNGHSRLETEGAISELRALAAEHEFRLQSHRDVMALGTAESLARLAKQGLSPLHKLDRLALELELPGLVGVEHRSRASAERPVVEKGNAGPEQEQVAQSVVSRGR